MPIGYHAEGTNGGEGLVRGFVALEKARGRTFLTRQNESTERVGAPLIVVEVKRLVEQW